MHCKLLRIMIARLLREARGASAIEFALMSPVALLMILAVAGLGLAFASRLQVESTLNGLQLEALRGTAAQTQALVQQRLEALDGVGGLQLLDGLSVTEGFGCATAASSDTPVHAGWTSYDDCACGTAACYRYYVVDADFTYDLLFGWEIGGLSSINIPADRTILVDGGWR